ncbi:hypothetical protein [Nitrosospira briensis]|uniref:hypothetical protein n=1 Tax=Nitrosospira briensis TaxID=35799 RepID=UPI0012E1113C|nr:hypothetical protein [Nitrosospira briensis]
MGKLLVLLEIIDFAYDLLSPTETQGPEADNTHAPSENSHAQAPETHPEAHDSQPSHLDNSPTGHESASPDNGGFDGGSDGD